MEDNYNLNIITSSLQVSLGHHTSHTLTRLQFRKGFSGLDVGRYYCITGEEGNQDVARQSVVIGLSTDYTRANGSEGDIPPCVREADPIAYFQIRVLDIDRIQWEEVGMRDLKEDVRAEFTEVVIGAVALQCSNCFVDQSSPLTVLSPMRSTRVSKAAIFRGVVNTTQGDRAKAILCALDAWAQSGPLTYISGEFLAVDKNCIITPSSLDSRECPRSVTERALPALGSSGIFILLVVLVGATIATAILSILKW